MFVFLAVTEKAVFGGMMPDVGTVNIISESDVTCVVPPGRVVGVTIHVIGPVYAVLTCCVIENCFCVVDVSRTWLPRDVSVGRTAAPISNDTDDVNPPGVLAVKLNV